MDTYILVDTWISNILEHYIWSAHSEIDPIRRIATRENNRNHLPGGNSLRGFGRSNQMTFVQTIIRSRYIRIDAILNENELLDIS